MLSSDPTNKPKAFKWKQFIILTLVYYVITSLVFALIVGSWDLNTWSNPQKNSFMIFTPIIALYLALNTIIVNSKP